MQHSLLNHRFPLAVAGAYLVPLLFWSLFVLRYVPDTVGFWALGLGWLLMAVGTLVVFLYTRSLGGEEKKSGPQEEISPPQKVALGDQKNYAQQVEELTKELGNARDQGIKNLKDKELLILELQRTVAEQKEKLETIDLKMWESTKEIRRLIKGEARVSKVEEERHTDPQKESASLLQRCMQIAEQHTGAWSFNPQMSHSTDVSLDSYALDQRRLYQALSRENRGVVFLYSPSKEKVLFVNQETKSQLGWNPELFAQDFDHIMQGGRQEWKEAISTLPTKETAELTLPFKQSNHEKVSCHCQLGWVPKGLFKNHVIGVLIPKKSSRIY